MTTPTDTPLIITALYPNEPRKCKHFITAILKQGLVTSIQRDNYVKSYTLVEGKVVKEEVKRLTIETTKEKKEKLLSVIQKLCPTISLQ